MSLPNTHSVLDTHDRGAFLHLCFDIGCHRKKYVMRTFDPLLAPVFSFHILEHCISSVLGIGGRVLHRQPLSGIQTLLDKSYAQSTLCCPQHRDLPCQGHVCASTHCRRYSWNRRWRPDTCLAYMNSSVLRCFAKIVQGHMPGMTCVTPQTNLLGTRRT